ncbi:transglutaminase domain-containing protein [Mycolicibacterium vaccae]|nr:transglutaminase domain-containing protein [Mycolicibacterium vaccae]
MRRRAVDILTAQRVRARDYLGEIKALFEWVQGNIRYTRDPHRVELLHSARRMLELRAGDCDDMTILLGAMLQSIGHPVRIVVIGPNARRPDLFSHVYPEVQFRGRWIAADATVPHPMGWKPRAIVKKVISLQRRPVMSMSDIDDGLGQPYGAAELVEAVRTSGLQPRDPRVRGVWDALRARGMLSRDPWVAAAAAATLAARTTAGQPPAQCGPAGRRAAKFRSARIPGSGRVGLLPLRLLRHLPLRRALLPRRPLLRGRHALLPAAGSRPLALSGAAGGRASPPVLPADGAAALKPHREKEIETMARVTGVKEKLHSPLYDAIFINEGETLADVMRDPSVIRFFVDVQNKTRLETNLQASGVLPSLNTFEARAMRVVVSGPNPDRYDTRDLFIPELIYGSVVSLLVGEKEAITAPTYMFPSGAGVLGSNGEMPLTHGEPDPLSTFRFAEPVFIDPQQNFRVEMLFPRGAARCCSRRSTPGTSGWSSTAT